MKLREIIAVVQGTLVCGDPDSGIEVRYGFASDLMSDVLTLLDEQILMITGLSNTQSINTAALSDIHIILLTRGKKPTRQMVELAEKQGIILVTTPFSSFKSSALLYQQGLQAIY